MLLPQASPCGVCVMTFHHSHSRTLDPVPSLTGYWSYVIDSFAVGAQRVGYLHAGADYAEQMDASNELACGHLPIHGCSCLQRTR